MKAYSLSQVCSTSWLLVVCLLGSPVQNSAQTVGFGGGSTVSRVRWLYPPPDAENGFVIVEGSSHRDRTGTGFYASFRFDPLPVLGAETGLRLVSKGFEVTEPTFEITYLEIPMLGIVQTGPGWGLFAEGGLVVGFRAQCKRFFNGVLGYHEDGCGRAQHGPLDLAPLRRWDVSWDLGVGLRFPLPVGRIVGAVRKQQSIFDLMPDEPYDTRSRMVNRVTSWSIGYELPLRRR